MSAVLFRVKCQTNLLNHHVNINKTYICFLYRQLILIPYACSIVLYSTVHYAQGSPLHIMHICICIFAQMVLTSKRNKKIQLPLTFGFWYF